MLSIQQIQDILNQSNKANKKLDELRQRWHDVYIGMSVHIDGACPRFRDADGRLIYPPNYFGNEYQILFDRILMNRHPRESLVTRDWRFSQYKPFTKSAFALIIELIGGTIFQQTNYNLIISNDADAEYVWGRNFHNYDIIQFFNWSLSHIMVDPNGYFLRIPKKPAAETTTNKIEPDIIFIWSHNVIFVSEDELIFKDETGEYIWVVNRVSILRFKRDKSKPYVEQWGLMDGEAGGYYAHELGYVPADVAGGIWSTQGFYFSWLDKAKAIADEYISSKSAEQLVDKEASHPFITISTEDCPECHGSGQIQVECRECPEGKELIECTMCHGKGLVSQNPGERLEAPPDLMDRDLIKITNPDVGINTYLFNKNKELYNQILDALNLLKIDEAQSGVAKIIDQERLYHFVCNISNDIFGRLIYNSIRDIIAYRNTTSINGQTVPYVYNFKLVIPTQFRIKTSQDLLKDYTEGTNSKIPGYLRSALLKEYVDKQFSDDVVMQRKTDLIIQMDKCSPYSIDEQTAMVTSGEVSQRDLQFSADLPIILDRINREKGTDWFLTASYDAIDILVQQYFNETRMPLIPIVNTPPSPPPAAATPPL